MRLGVLDIGSNTVHLLIVDAHPGAAPLPAWKSKISLRLAEHVRPDGRIDERAIDELVAFAREARQRAEDLGVTEFLAFATSAIREAPNSREVIAAVRDRAGLDVEVLSGDEEARLTRDGLYGLIGDAVDDPGGLGAGGGGGDGGLEARGGGEWIGRGGAGRGGALC